MEIIKKLRQKKWKKDQILILFLAGVLLLVIALPVREPAEQEEGQGIERAQISSSGDRAYAGYLEGRLEKVLSQMAGAGDVTAMVTLASSGEKVVEKDLEKGSETVTESDGQGGTRTTGSATSAQTAVYAESEGQGQQPYVSKEVAPEVEGVVILAQGGDDPVVEQEITQAVQALFGIDTHKIRIMKKQ